MRAVSAAKGTWNIFFEKKRREINRCGTFRQTAHSVKETQLPQRMPFRSLLLSVLMCAILPASPVSAQQPAASSGLSPCKGSPLDSRVRVAMGDAQVSTPGVSQLAANQLCLMLSDALTETSCFRVLKRNPVPEWPMTEVPAAITPQFLVTICLAEFNRRAVDRKSSFSLLRRTGSGLTELTKAHISFRVSVIYIPTAAILYSGDFEGDATEAGKGTDDDSVFKTRAMREAARKAVLDTAAWLVSELDTLRAAASGGEPRHATQTALQISGADTIGLDRIGQALRALPGVQSVQQNLSGDFARFDVLHTCPVDDLFVALDNGQCGTQVKVTGVRIEGIVK
ncbi:MAG: hypothetical protein IT262_07250 [Saprospiraceae bacterium]|nr:hypothetical protein [Saprospiraceae bacterium]